MKTLIQTSEVQSKTIGADIKAYIEKVTNENLKQLSAGEAGKNVAVNLSLVGFQQNDT